MPKRIGLVVLFLAIAGLVWWLALGHRGSRAATAAPGSATPVAPSTAQPRATPALATSDEAPSDSPGAIVVRVARDGSAATQIPVRCYVRLPRAHDDPWRLVGASVTGERGQARFPAAAGVYLVAAHPPGHPAARRAVRRELADAVTELDLSLVDGATLDGEVVVKRTREPVPFASLELIHDFFDELFVGAGAPEEEIVHLAADSRGRFRADGLTPGRYSATVRAPTLQTVSTRDVAVPHGGPWVIEMESGSFVEGYVALPDGKPAAGAEVVAQGPAGSAHDRSGATGGYSIEVRPGTVRVVARLGDLAGEAPGTVSIPPGETVRRVNVVLAGASAIDGRVTRAKTGVPVKGAEVELRSGQGDDAPHRSTTDDAGAFSFRPLAPGRYSVRVQADGFAEARKEGLQLSSGERFLVDVALTGLGSVAGTVRDGGGRPIAGARVKRNYGGPFDPLVTTDARGAYRLDDLPAGVLEIEASRANALGAVVRTVTIAEGEESRADFVLPGNGFIEGVVREADGSLVSGPVTVLVTSPPGGSDHFSAKEGRFHTAVRPGDHQLAAFPGEEFGAQGEPVQVAVREGETSRVELRLAARSERRKVEGVVLEPGGGPASFATIALTDGAQGTFTSADEAGHFEFNTVPVPGRTLTFHARNGGRTAKVVVPAGPEPLVVRLRAAASLGGELISAGKPVRQFTLVISIPEWEAPGGAMGGEQYTFQGDRFALSDVPADLLVVSVKTDDGRTAYASYRPEPGGTMHASLRLDPGGSVAGRVLDRSGAPLAMAQVWIGPDERLTGATGRSATDGRFRIDGLAAGPHPLSILDPLTGASLLDRTVEIEESEVTDLGDVRLAPPHAASGDGGPR